MRFFARQEGGSFAAPMAPAAPPQSRAKPASLDCDPAFAEKAWTKLIEIEGQGSFAAKTHYELANLYRKQGNAAKARHEMQEFQKLQNPQPQPPKPPG